MDDTTKTTVALLQQSLTSIEKSLTRLETKLDKYEEATRTFMPRTELKEEFAQYVTLEQYNTLKDKVGGITKALWIVGSAVAGELVHIVWNLIRGGA